MLNIIDFFIELGIRAVEEFGYWGIFVTMLLESAAIPIPSEIVLPLGGFNASLGSMNLWLVTLVATLANIAGSTILYFFGFFGGRPILEKYGKYLLIHKNDLAKLDSWLSRRGAIAVFFSRLLPAIRTFGALVFGAGKVRYATFLLHTASGSFIWNFILAYAGFTLGANWQSLRPYFEKFDVVIALFALLAVGWFIKKHILSTKKREYVKENSL